MTEQTDQPQPKRGRPDPRTDPRFRKALDKPWDDIKSCFINGANLKQLSNDYSINYHTLYMRARREGWMKHAKPASVRSRLHTQVIKSVDRLEEDVAKLPLREHVDTLATVARTAALVEGWATNSGTVNIAVVTSAQRDAVDLTPECIDVESSTEKPGYT